MDPNAIYAFLVAAVLVACAALILVIGIVREAAARRALRGDDPTAEFMTVGHLADYGDEVIPDVGPCIIAGCTNWSEDTICRECIQRRTWSGLTYGGAA